MNIALRPQVDVRSKVKLGLRIKFSQIHALPEKQFAVMVRQIEGHPLFQRLLGLEDPRWKAVKFRQFAHTRGAPGFQLMADSALVPERSDFGSFLQEKEEVIPIIRKIGEADFIRFFLNGEIGEASAETVASWNLRPGDLSKVLDFTNAVAVHSTFDAVPDSRSEQLMSYSRIAEVYVDDEAGDENVKISFYSPHLSRGRYVIDYGKLEKLKKDASFSREEKGRLRSLLEAMELINARKSMIYNLIKVVAARQQEYIRTGDQSRLRAFSQKELAEELQVNPSTVCRAIYGRSIVTPWKEEKPLEFFLPNLKAIRQLKMKSLMVEGGENLTDEEISIYLRQKYNLAISRRSVGYYRKEMRMGGNGGGRKS